jgi:hypothetical protein
MAETPKVDTGRDTLIRDPEIRAELHRHIRTAHPEHADTVVIDELGLYQGRARVDVAVINGSLAGYLAGYEIKSDRDTLGRLASQLAIYGLFFDAMTIVVVRRHLANARKIIPHWWGIIEAVPSSGGVRFIGRRRANRNSRVRPEALVRLLWKDEAVFVAQKLGVLVDRTKATRQFLWQQILRKASTKALRFIVRERIKARGDWRSDPKLSRYGDSYQSRAKSENHQDHPWSSLLSESVRLPS